MCQKWQPEKTEDRGKAENGNIEKQNDWRNDWNEEMWRMKGRTTEEKISNVLWQNGKKEWKMTKEDINVWNNNVEDSYMKYESWNEEESGENKALTDLRLCVGNFKKLKWQANEEDKAAGWMKIWRMKANVK